MQLPDQEGTIIPFYLKGTQLLIDHKIPDYDDLHISNRCIQTAKCPVIDITLPTPWVPKASTPMKDPHFRINNAMSEDPTQSDDAHR